MKNFRKRLLDFIKEKSPNQKEFAKEIGYSEQNISNVLTGTTKVAKIDLLISLVKRYPDVDLYHLLLGDDYLTLKKSSTITHEQYEELRSEIDELQKRLNDLH